MDQRIGRADDVLVNEFRKRISEFMSYLAEHPRKVLRLMRRTNVSAFVVSTDPYASLFAALAEPDRERRLKDSMVWLVVDQWLRDAPAHIREPQLQELGRLPPRTIAELMMADPERATAKSLEALGVERALATRLLKRRKIAKAIASAERENLYEAVDHKASLVG